MLTFLHTLWHLPLIHGAMLGWGVAARLDYVAFKSWKSADEAWKYDWKLAAWRWFQGAVIGAGGESGFSFT